MRSFLEKIMYKKVFVGKYEQDGKTCVKYKRVRRFQFRMSPVLLIVLIATIAGIIFTIFMSGMNNSPVKTEDFYNTTK